MGLRCTLRSVLWQDPITPNSKQPTHNRALWHAEVSAATKPLPVQLYTTQLQWGPIARTATGPHHSDLETTDSQWGSSAR